MTQSGPPNTPKAKDAALLTLMERSGYNIVQENGQRKFGPPPDWTGNPPPKGCEVFVGKLPRDLYEDELVPVFEEIGKIYEVRLMMDFSGSNRGFAFVMYTCADDAKRAVKELDNYEIRKGRFIGVCKSVDNCRLFVGGIPKTKTKEEILEEMKKITDYVSDVILYSSMTDKTKNRGFAFVEYENHRAAAMARRKLIPGKIQIWGHDIAVDWAEPEPEVDETIMSKVTILYVRNLMMTTTEDHLKEVFSLNDTVKVEKVKKLRDFAFVHYRSREDAEAALAELNDTEVDNSIIEVTWAKPVDRTTTRQRSRSGTGQPLPAYNPYMYSSGLDVYSGAISTITPCPSSCPLPPHISARGRGRGAAGVRRLRNYGRGPSVSGTYKPVEARLVELLPNMELVPTNPYTLRPARRPLQVLMDACQKNSWGEPIFQLHSTAHDSNENSQLFVYKVTIPSLPAQFNQFQPNKLSRMPEEAKQYAAEYVLMQLGLSFDGIEPSIAVTPSGIASYSGHPRLGPPGYLHPSAAYDPSSFYEMIPQPSPHVPLY